MSLTIVVGGQYGSEGKGKVSYHWAKTHKVDIAIKVGGMNSGHTAYHKGKKYVFKSLPTPALLGGVTAVIPSGAYISTDNLISEIQQSSLKPESLFIDPYAVIIKDSDIDIEKASGLIENIGSTGSGTGIAVANRCLRSDKTVFAKDIEMLKIYLKDTKKILRESIKNDKHIIVEGTQGFGLSLLHSNMYPFVTSRDTTAAGFLSEVGLSPFDVTDIIMTIRAFPIRVAGNSGELKNETTWKQVGNEAGCIEDITEYTSVTKKIRRVARFDKNVVNEAILVNKPTKIILNHLDYIDYDIHNDTKLSQKALKFVKEIEELISSKIDYVGIDPFKCIKR